jgi:hypothetical protein
LAIASVLEKDLAKATSIFEQVATLVGPFNPNLALTLDLLGTVCYCNGNLTEARHFLQRALQLKRCSDIYKCSPSLASTLRTLACVLRAEKADSTEATAYDTEADQLTESIFAIKDCPK